MSAKPRPLATMPDAARRAIRFVLTDIDDTLTTGGKLTADAYAALARLHDAGKIVVPVTGRPAGWCDHIARMWPVAAVVGENGAFYMRFDAKLRKLVQRFAASDDERKRLRAQQQADMQDAARLTDATLALAAGAYDPESLVEVARRPDPLGQLARSIQRLARAVVLRESGPEDRC